MELVYHPNKLLETKCDEVDIKNINFDPKEIKAKMVAFMLNNNGIGLSANQVGITDKRLFVMADINDKSQSIICINPTILQHTAEHVIMEEGCMSFPGTWLKVKRPKEILVHFYDEDLVEQVFKMDGPNARIYLHEMDHTLGITFKDRVTRPKWELAERKRKKLEKRTQAA